MKFTREIVLLATLVAFLLTEIQSAELSAAPQATAAQEQGTVYLHETFDGYETDKAPEATQLQRSAKVTVVEGNDKVGSGKVARFDDSDTEAGGAMEYNVGASALGTMFVEFDALNNDPAKGDKLSNAIFGVGPWATGKSLVLNSKAKRAFGFEMYQQKYLKLRVGNDIVTQVKYDPAAAFNVKIWANDHDENALSYKRPDNGEDASLKPDSVVVWLNDSLFGELQPEGSPMHGDVTKGDAVIGRLGWSSASTKVADFLIDNLHVEDPSGEAKKTEDEPKPAVPESGKAGPTDTGESTPAGLPGAEAMSYRKGENAMSLFVYKPEGWKADDKRSALIYFFGGGWTKGTPEKSAAKAAWAAKNGMIGIAPDYRTKNRFGTSPLASVDDGRAAYAWVLDHADELGIDPARIAVGGSSAGGHVALWTAIENAPPGSDPATSPKSKPAAIFLTSAVTDTSPETGYTPARFGDDALALSPVHQLDANMPPLVMFHAAFDELVHYGTAVAIHKKLVSTGSSSELVTVPDGGHGFTSEKEWKQKVQTKLEEMLTREGLLPAVR